MGGIGSGRWNRHQRKQTVNDALRLNARRLIIDIGKENMTRKSYGNGVLSWGRESTKVNVEFDNRKPPPHVVLRYTVSNKEIEQCVDFSSDLTPWGSVRWWLICPQCKGRCVMLYLPEGGMRFACRQCHNLSYASAQEAHRFERSTLGETMRMVSKSDRLHALTRRLSRQHVGSKMFLRTLERIRKLEKELSVNGMLLPAMFIQVDD
jgi:hypothetical protein